MVAFGIGIKIAHEQQRLLVVNIIGFQNSKKLLDEIKKIYLNFDVWDGK